jgi:DNA polymerase III alpha subunit
MAGHFVPLHSCSHYSLLEGVDSPATLLERAAAVGYPALALTDVNSLAGAVEFTAAARAFGVRAILGARLRQQGQQTTVLIAEPAGWRNLSRIISRIHRQGAQPLARLLADNPEGLHLLVDNAFALKPPLPEAFRGRLWAEVIRPGGSESSERALAEVGARYGARPVASLGAAFAIGSGYPTYRLLTAVRQGQALEDLPGRLAVGLAHHLADPGEVAERFRDLPDALANAGRLAEVCRSDVLPRGVVMPPAKLPDGQDADGYLRLLCERALPRRADQDEPGLRRRLAQELALIAQASLGPYFLAVGEIAAEARRRGWPLSLRGSAGSSLVCHLLGISDINPLHHGLRLERFLHAGRADVPDIDLDFAAQFRAGLFTWVVRHFGDAHVARVGLWHRFKGPSAFQAASIAHGVSKTHLRPLLEAAGAGVDQLDSGEGPLPEGLAVPPATFPLEPAVWPRLLADARRLVGRPHQLVAHPCGFLLTAQPAEDCVALQRGAGGVGLTQLDQHAVEAVGLVKIDLLSNRALSTLAEAGEHAKALVPAEPMAPPGGDDSDPATLALLARGDTLGVSHLETPGMRGLLRQLRPRSLADLAQALAVTRPGASAGGGRDTFLRRRTGAEAPTYAHPALEEVLKESHGVPLYDDDLIGVIEVLAGLPGAEADTLRRRLTHPPTAEQAGAAFLSLAENAGVGRAGAELALAQVVKFRGYSFCKAHALATAFIAWQECRLKARCPLAFWTAVLNNHEGAYPRRVHVEAAKRGGLAVYLPCVNRSQLAWTQEVSGLRTGLSAVRALDRGVAEALIEERQRGGPYQTLADFRRRVTSAPQDLALLIRVGCFDFTGRSRAALLREAEVLQQGRLPPWWEGREEFEPWPLEALEGYALSDQWRQEWELLGFLAGPPLLSLVRACVPPVLVDSRRLGSLAGKKVRLAGLVAATKEAAGSQSPTLTLEDEWGLLEVEVQGGADPAALGPVVVVEGEVQERHRVPVVVAARLTRPLPGALAEPPLGAAADARLNGAAAHKGEGQTPR